MARPQQPAGISHDPNDAPMFTHKVFIIYWSFLNANVLAIQDDDRAHYPFLKQWVGMEVDIENQWSINNGTLGLDMVLHNAGKHRMEYCVRLKIPEAELILKTQYNIIGIINEQKRMIYGFRPLKIKELEEFVQFKKDLDAKIKHEHIHPKGWSFE